MKQVNSRGVKAYQYFPDEQRLRVTWASGRTYDHPGITPEMVLGMEAEDSLGSWCARTLNRPEHKGREVVNG